MAGASPNLSAAKRFQATMRSNNPGIVPDKEGTARTLDAARRWQQSMRMRDPGIVGNATSELSKALVRSAPSEIATRAAGDMVKRESGDIARRASGELVKREAGDIAKRGAGELVKRGAGEIATRGSGEMVKRGAGELVKRGAGELAKVAASEGGKAGMRQIAGQVARTAPGIGVEGGKYLVAPTGFNVLPAAAAIGVADYATKYRRAKYTQNFGGPQFDQNPYARTNDNMKKGMKYGMKDTQGNPFSGHLTGMGGPVEDLLGYGVSLVQRGRNFDEARKLITGSEKFRNLSEPVQQAVLSHYDFWRVGQSKGKNIGRIVDNATKPTMRRPTNEPMPR